jgi:hypothetical protein
VGVFQGSSFRRQFAVCLSSLPAMPLRSPRPPDIALVASHPHLLAAAPVRDHLLPSLVVVIAAYQRAVD